MADSKSAISVVFYSWGGPRKIISRIQDEEIKNAAAEDLAYMLLDKVNEYVPVSTGKLKARGYKIRFSSAKRAVSILSYNNRPGLPYVLYQYYGVVYGPNYATWEGSKKPKSLKNLKLTNSPAKHVGWISPAGKGSKHPTKNQLGEKRPPLVLKDGRIITYTGYTGNPNAHIKWLEYVRTTPTIWYKLRQNMIKFIESVYSAYVFDNRESMLYANKAIEEWHGRKIDFKKFTAKRKEIRELGNYNLKYRKRK